ncbi:MAG: hypothetical protein IJE07_01410 [Clostridia bacterium]|nr:hypothetical protein [Clostridia bacterium]
MKKIFSFMMIFALIFGAMSVSASADTIFAPRSSNCFHCYGTSMGDAGNGVLSITFDCVGMGICSQLGVASYTVEKLDDEGNWENVSGLLEGQTGSDCASYSFGRYFYGRVGETYRLCVTFICTLNGLTESRVYTSGSITLQ